MILNLQKLLTIIQLIRHLVLRNQYSKAVKHFSKWTKFSETETEAHHIKWLRDWCPPCSGRMWILDS